MKVEDGPQEEGLQMEQPQQGRTKAASAAEVLSTHTARQAIDAPKRIFHFSTMKRLCS